MGVKVKFEPLNPNHLIVGLAGLGFAYFVFKETSKAAKKAVSKVNPVDSNNFINQGFEAVGEAVTGQEGWSLGTWLADKLNPTEFQAGRHDIGQYD